MSFFVTSTPKGDGANYGGLAGADAHCQMLAKAAGRGDVTWRAYLSTQGSGAVHARDRIGSGPWYGARGSMIAANQAELHGDTIELARLGNRVNKNTARDEKGEFVKGVGDRPNQHDILTGSMPDGRAFTDGMDHHLQQLHEQRRRQGFGTGRSPRQDRRRERILELRPREPRLQPGEPGRNRWQRPLVLLRAGQLSCSFAIVKRPGDPGLRLLRARCWCRCYAREPPHITAVVTPQEGIYDVLRR